MTRAKTDELIEMPFGVWTRVGAKELCIRRGVGSPKEGGNLGDISQPVVKYNEYLGCGRYFQPQPVSGSSSGATFRCQYCSSLLTIVMARV